MRYPRTIKPLRNVLALFLLAASAATAAVGSVAAQARVPGARAAAPEESLKAARDLYEEGVVLYQQGRYAEAAERMERGLKIFEQRVSPNNPELALALNNLSVVYQGSGNFTRAETLARRALRIQESAFGPDHPTLGVTLNTLGWLNKELGNYKEAEALFRRSLAVLRRAGTPDRLTVATVTNNLALVYVQTGDFAQAEELLQQTLRTREELLRPSDPEVAKVLDNLGWVYQMRGDYRAAARAHLRALPIFVNALGQVHPDVAIAVNNLALLYKLAGELDDAEFYSRLALEIRRELYEGDHREIATSLSDLAGVYQAKGDYARAEGLLADSLTMRERLFGAEHPDVAVSLNNLGYLFQTKGDYARAEPYYLRAVSLLERLHGPNYPRLAITLNSLAMLYQATGRAELAVRSLERALSIQQQNIGNVFGAASEGAMQAYLSTISLTPDVLVNVAESRKADEPAAVEKTLTWVLRRKGIILDTLTRFRQAQALAGRDPLVAKKAARLRELLQRLSDLPLSRPAGDDAEATRAELARLRGESDQLQAELNRALSAGRAAQSPPDADAVKRRLTARAALVEFVRVEGVDFKATGAQPFRRPAHYFAFVLNAGPPSRPLMLDLGPADAIDRAVSRLSLSISDFKDAWQSNKVASPENPGGLIDEGDAEQSCREAGRELYDLAFAPVRKALGASVATIYVAPDDQLNLVPFAALVDERGKYLIESFRFAYVTTGRDLLRPREGASNGTAVFSDPDYDLAAAEREQKARVLPAQSGTSAAAGAFSTYSGELPPELGEELRHERVVRGGTRWGRLESGLAEARDVGELLGAGSYGPVKLYLRGEALEESFKRVRSPRVLHVSTHGFFIEAKEEEEPPASGLLDAGNAAVVGMELLRRAGGGNPLLRSGLVLAGANRLGERGAAGLALDDGWVTAEEIAQMDLRGTELVVLSACETGLGDVRTGEGVYGLRRAFQLAGARSVVSTLFKVPDRNARDLMRNFYGALKSGMSELSALHDTQLEAVRRLRARPSNAAHPFFWAGFVLTGVEG